MTRKTKRTPAGREPVSHASPAAGVRLEVQEMTFRDSMPTYSAPGYPEPGSCPEHNSEGCSGAASVLATTADPTAWRGILLCDDCADAIEEVS